MPLWGAMILEMTPSSASESLDERGFSPCPTRSSVATIVWPPAAAPPGPGAGPAAGPPKAGAVAGAVAGAGRPPLAPGMRTI